MSVNTAAFGSLVDGQHPVWIGDFTGVGHAQVLFYYAGDGNWWLRDFKAANWVNVDNTAGFDNLVDGKHTHEHEEPIYAHAFGPTADIVTRGREGSTLDPIAVMIKLAHVQHPMT